MLESFFGQRFLEDIDYELIIVDNNSQDETRSLVAKYSSNGKCRYIFEEKQGLSLARNRAVKESKGDILAFLDDDVIVDRNWLKKLKECYEETNADVVGGRAYLKFEKEPPDWLGQQFRTFLSLVDFGDDRQFFSGGDGLWGVNLSFRKSVLEAVGGFDENLGRRGSELIAGEDTVLLKKIASLKKKIVYEPSAIVRHLIGPERLEWDYFLRHSIGMGKTNALVETRCRAAWQLLRVGRTLLNYLGSNLELIRVVLFNSGEYEKKLAKWISKKEKSYLIARWKRLWSSF